MKKCFIFFAILIFSFCLASCGEKHLSGLYEYNLYGSGTSSYEFVDDDSVKINVGGRLIMGEYRTEENKVEVIPENGSWKSAQVFTYDEKEDTLTTVTDQKTIVYRKK